MRRIPEQRVVELGPGWHDLMNLCLAVVDIITSPEAQGRQRCQYGQTGLVERSRKPGENEVLYAVEGGAHQPLICLRNTAFEAFDMGFTRQKFSQRLCQLEE